MGNSPVARDRGKSIQIDEQSLSNRSDTFRHLLFRELLAGDGARGASAIQELDGWRSTVKTRDTYDVFDAEGRWLATVLIPMEITEVLDVGRSYLLGKRKDDNDVEYLRVFTLPRPIR